MPAALDDDHWSSRAVPKCYRALAVQGGMKMGAKVSRDVPLAMVVPIFDCPRAACGVRGWTAFRG